ncbi:HAD-IC family P-type ATPase [Dactylosporangium roseum]|uniref:HAD-IC family P-type ATPase n=1 Tax=Dactylosporangium roseum TaxID=47989 RepID=A0ABY5Z346_9ACTN|nr:HAD-IC family P-type ATPase [Dactylosporangium roseum]UWZ36456.1 HAD-IC family P-type ATPase [Dactylosporangium roseum]
MTDAPIAITSASTGSAGFTGSLTDQPLAWHAVTVPDVLTALDSTPDGLAEPQRAARLAGCGPNTVTSRKPKRWLPELAESFTEPLQLLLIAVAVLSALFGELSDAVAIAVVIAAVAVLETATEMRTARAIDALRTMSAPTARLTAGRPVPAADLVPGDVIQIAAGDLVPADARLLAARGLRVDESTRTGEAHPVGKDPRPVPADTALADRASILYAGTAVQAGEGTAVVVATSARTELGRLGKLVADAKEPPTPLQRTLAQLARAVLVLAIAASILVPVVGLLAGQPLQDMILSGLTVAFATVPEELPILVVVLLAVGGRQLARHGALLRRLRAGETLGAVTVVVTDKTGTLTEHQLRLGDIHGERRHVLTVALATQPRPGAARDPMETQLAGAAHRLGLPDPAEDLVAFPFDPHRKLVSRAHPNPNIGPQPNRDAGGVWLAVAGAPEAILGRCRLDPAQRAKLDAHVHDLARQGLRVIAFAERVLPGIPQNRDAAETDLTYVGLATFTDPLRPGVAEAVAALTTAGVATIVVTGDHPDTAAAIAAQAGLTAGRSIPRGGDLTELPDADLQPLLTHGAVVARATPATKHRVVTALQQRGEIVAVTGDGANDAPALAAADVGIALGARGADLARAAADLVLTDDAYPTVVTAIAKGRNISAQLRRAVAFYLGAKLALVIVLLAALTCGLPVPFDPVHIVLLEVFMDLGASVAFIAEPAAPAAMRQPPRPPGARFLDRPELAALAAVAATLTVATLPGYLLLAHTHLGAARAAAILGWLAGHAAIAWTLRTRPGLSWRANPAFPAWAAIATLTGFIVALTPAGRLIHLSAPSAAALAGVGAAVLTAIVAATITRRLLRFTARL